MICALSRHLGERHHRATPGSLLRSALIFQDLGFSIYRMKKKEKKMDDPTYTDVEVPTPNKKINKMDEPTYQMSTCPQHLLIRFCLAALSLRAVLWWPGRVVMQAAVVQRPSPLLQLVVAGQSGEACSWGMVALPAAADGGP